MRVDDPVRRGLDEVPPVDPTRGHERFVEKRVRRRIDRKVQTVALAVAVVTGSVASFLALSRVFGSTTTPVSGAMLNGRIVFAGGEYPEYDVYSVNPDGSDLRDLTNTPGIEDVYASVSPDGTRIAFCRFERMADGVRGGVWVMNADGGDEIQLTDTGNEYCYPTWPPDQTRLALQGDRGIFVMDEDGSDLVRITSGDDWYPAWSPNGDWIAFHRTILDEHGYSDIYLVHPDGTDLRRITSGASQNIMPSWSPEGDRLVFVSVTHGSLVVATMNADGSDQTEVTTNADGFGGREPFWSPDGTRIGFVGKDGIMTIAVDGSDAQLVFANNSTFSNLHPTWQPIAGATLDTTSSDSD